MKSVLVDSGFWFALYDERDEHNSTAIAIEKFLDSNIIVIPFPTLYESINTKFMKNKKAKNEFKKVLNRTNAKIISDESIKYNALEVTFTDKSKERNLSLVDNIIRLILDDVKFNINYLITFNRGDFVDICNRRGIQILDN
ncbi:MAG: hypothetical protein LBT27_05810 [Prevotellaceae bacterium]|jgi:predicted nucleic acid-binding protein|nr:hypothetical protein [Prevotellaceae bacterium]